MKTSRRGKNEISEGTHKRLQPAFMYLLCLYFRGRKTEAQAARMSKASEGVRFINSLDLLNFPFEKFGYQK